MPKSTPKRNPASKLSAPNPDIEAFRKSHINPAAVAHLKSREAHFKLVGSDHGVPIWKRVK